RRELAHPASWVRHPRRSMVHSPGQPMTCAPARQAPTTWTADPRSVRTTAPRRSRWACRHLGLPRCSGEDSPEGRERLAKKTERPATSVRALPIEGHPLSEDEKVDKPRRTRRTTTKKTQDQAAAALPDEVAAQSELTAETVAEPEPEK